MKIKIVFPPLLFPIILFFLISSLHSQENSKSKNLIYELEKGKNLYYVAKFDEAISLFNNLLEELKSEEEESHLINELMADLHMYIAFSLLGKGEEGKAGEEFKIMLKIDPDKKKEITYESYGPKIIKILEKAILEFQGDLSELERINLSKDSGKESTTEGKIETEDLQSINELKYDKINTIQQKDLKEQDIEILKPESQKPAIKRYIKPEAKNKKTRTSKISKGKPNPQKKILGRKVDSKAKKITSSKQSNKTSIGKKKKSPSRLSSSYIKLKKKIFSIFKKKYSSKKASLKGQDKTQSKKAENKSADTKTNKKSKKKTSAKKKK